MWNHVERSTVFFYVNAALFGLDSYLYWSYILYLYKQVSAVAITVCLSCLQYVPYKLSADMSVPLYMLVDK